MIHAYPSGFDADLDAANRWTHFTDDELKNISYHASLGSVAMEAYRELRRRQEEGGEGS